MLTLTERIDELAPDNRKIIFDPVPRVDGIDSAGDPLTEVGWEFEPVEGEPPIRLFHESLHPDISWQLDVYWAQTAGADPAAIVTELMPRLGSIHWKDGPAVHGEPMTTLCRAGRAGGESPVRDRLRRGAGRARLGLQ